MPNYQLYVISSGRVVLAGSCDEKPFVHVKHITFTAQKVSQPPLAMPNLHTGLKSYDFKMDSYDT